MKIKNVLAVSAVSAAAICMLTASAFASGNASQNSSSGRNMKNFGGRSEIARNNDNKGFKGMLNVIQGECKNQFSDLVAAGTITQAQVDAIQSAIKAGFELKQTPKEALDKLVTAGTITQVQEDAVLKAQPQRRGFEGRKGDRHKNLIADLITAGTITQQQADAIDSAIKARFESKQTLNEAIDTLVTAGTITQAQKDAVVAAFPAGHKCL